MLNKIDCNFITIMGGEYTISMNAIAFIDWTVSEKSCQVILINGSVFDLEGEDKENLESLFN